MTVTASRFLILISRDFNNFIFSVWSLLLEKICQELKTLFEHILLPAERRQIRKLRMY